MDRFSADNELQDDIPKHKLSKFIRSGDMPPSQFQSHGKVEVQASRNAMKAQAMMPPPPAQNTAQTDAHTVQKTIPVPSWAVAPPLPGVLIVTKAGYCVDKVTLKDSMTVFGRGQNADYVMDHQSLSRLHAAVCYQRATGKWVIFDLGSMHGTMYDGQPVKSQPVEIEVGRKIQLGASSRTLTLQESTEAAPDLSGSSENRQANVKIVLKEEARKDAEGGPLNDEQPGKFAGLLQEIYTPSSTAVAPTKKGIKRSHEQSRRHVISQPLNYGLYDHLPDAERWS